MRDAADDCLGVARPGPRGWRDRFGVCCRAQGYARGVKAGKRTGRDPVRDSAARAQTGASQSGYHRSSSGSIGSSCSSLACSCSSRSESRFLFAQRDERVEVAALEVVDEADVPRLEPEHGAQQLLAEPVVGHRLGGHVDGRDQVVEILVGQLQPLVAVLVDAAVHLRALVLERELDHVLDVGAALAEPGRRHRLEADRGVLRRLQPEARVERDLGGRDREQPLERRLGDLGATENPVEEPHPARSERLELALEPAQLLQPGLERGMVRDERRDAGLELRRG